MNSNKEFYVAWKYVPWLTIAIVFGALSGYIGGLFSAIKNSKIFAQSTAIGAATNIVLNVVLTPWIGALGASIATMICYFGIWIIRYWHLKKFVKIKINLGRDIFSYTILMTQAIILLIISKNWFVYCLETLLFLLLLLLYIRDILQILNRGKDKIKRIVDKN